MASGAAKQLQALVHQRTILLETKKRDGTWVGTPVNVVVDHDHAYFRTWSRSGKAKRLRNFSEVRVCPSTTRGKPTGPFLQARAHLVTGDEDRRASDLLVRKYPILHRLVRLWHRVRGFRTQHYELVPASR